MAELDYAKNYLTSSNGGYYGVKYGNSFFHYMTKQWNNLNVSTQLMALPDFKEQLKMELKKSGILPKVPNLAIHI